MHRWLVIIIILLGLAPAATAQTRYELDERGELVELPGPERGSPAWELEQIRSLIAEGEGKKARKQAEAWIKRHPNHPLVIQARLLRGDAWVAQERYYKALFDYEYVARVYPGTEEFFTALEREFEIARLFVNGMKRRLFGLRLLPADGEGEELLIRIQERVPGSDLGERASLMLADYYYDNAEMFLASEAYDIFLENYPESTRREWALLRLVLANLARFKGPRYDATGLLEARERIRLYVVEYPAAAERSGIDALLLRVNASLAASDYENGRWYERRGERVSAIAIYQRLIREHPQTEAARDAHERLQTIGTRP
ncbi:outer membrane protein assembly factor BamD [Mucisphaera calidilacus]|uniref:Outer membrane protein assembly factor BamD n=1 Tax=Mucisphaera calidilacus TaxID=2527982 RepID=A0A518BUM9_9BACT|nr:outer membrane protein assembly factor BamD [Mucisphaera calidilacus]QDU70693.1 Outer membrane protein assembly factor BamD [Mucisphaera calidilacus]